MSQDQLPSLLFLAVLLVSGYLLLIRPARKRAQEVTALQHALSIGDEVMLTSGIFATVVEVLDDRLRVAIADGVVIDVHRGAIAKIVRDVPADDPVDWDDDDTESSDDPDDSSGQTSPEKPGAN